MLCFQNQTNLSLGEACISRSIQHANLMLYVLMLLLMLLMLFFYIENNNNDDDDNNINIKISIAIINKQKTK